MENFVIRQLSAINFEDKVQQIANFLGSSSELSLIFVGVGKTAYVAQRLTASFVSMNVRCRYLHAADALHGDIGLISPEDQCVLLSYSGETAEILELARQLRHRSCGVISVTSRSGSSLQSLSDHSIFLECANGLPGFEKIPSISLYAMEILFDLFLVGYCEKNNKSLLDFARNHPAGGIGAWFGTPLKDIARDLSSICIEFDDSVNNISKKMDQLETGIAYITLNNKFVGCLTSGDVRRLSTAQNLALKLDDLNQTPIQVSQETSVQNALEVMKENDISVLFVTNLNSEIAAYVTMGDLIK